MTSAGQPFDVEHLWALQFGNGVAAGPTNTLFFTAGLTSHFGSGTGTPHGLFGSIQAVPTVPANTQIVPNLADFPQQIVPTVGANGDLNPYGVAFVPQNFKGGGQLARGDILVSNFNDSANVQATGSSIVLITPDGQQSTFFQAPSGLGLTTALGVLPQGFVLVGSAPAATVNGVNTVADGGLFVLDSKDNEVMELSDSALLRGPWDLTINNVDSIHAQVFVSNLLSGTVTRIDLTIPNGGTPQVESETQIASGYAHQSVIREEFNSRQTVSSWSSILAADDTETHGWFTRYTRSFCPGSHQGYLDIVLFPAGSSASLDRERVSAGATGCLTISLSPPVAILV